MKKLIIILTVLIAMTIKTNAQIPNNGFENWTTVNEHDSLIGWGSGNVTFSTDHYPVSVGQYSIKLTNNLPLINQDSYGYSTTNSLSNGCLPSFPISGHPNQLCGYYKCFPLNNDTIQIGLMLFNNGVWVAGAELITTNTVSDWTSFCIPISAYTVADSATITVAAFYNDTTCGMPYGPYGNSILYVDNLSFDNLITSVSEQTSENTTFSLYPNPASDFVTINFNRKNDEVYTLNIYNVIGTLVKSETLKQNNQQINIGDLSIGAYMVTFKSKDFAENQKLIIQR